MRESLRNIVKKAVVFEYHLPNEGNDVERSVLSTKKDVCFRNDDPSLISEIIYNGIIEYAKNEYKIEYDDLNKEQRKALKLSIRYNNDANDAAKLKYGFFGEVLLYSILKCHFEAEVLISKGYFYNPLERGEAKGYDVFHLIEKKESLELWFGESKFHESYAQALKSILGNISKALSDEYFERNLLAIIQQKDNITTEASKMDEIIRKWEENPDIKLVDEINNSKIKVVYPMFVAFEKLTSVDYHENIKRCIKHVSSEHLNHSIAIPATFDISLFFIFLPLSGVKQTKEAVIEWITLQKPLI